MEATRIDLSRAQAHSGQDISGLKSCLDQLVGEPFRLARVSYGDELTLHFGDLRPARASKLKGKLYGAFILGLRGSPWILKSGTESVVVTAGEMFEPPPTHFGVRLGKEDLESGKFIDPESRVLRATPFAVKPVDGFGLELRMSDGSTLLVLPTVPDDDGPEDEGLPRLADWELLSPHGLLQAGPGVDWSFEPSERDTPPRKGDLYTFDAWFDMIKASSYNAKLPDPANEIKFPPFALMFEDEGDDFRTRIEHLWSIHTEGHLVDADLLELPTEDRERLIRQYARFIRQIRLVRRAMSDYFAGQRFFDFYAGTPEKVDAELELALSDPLRMRHRMTRGEK